MSVRERLFLRLAELAARFGVVRREGVELSLRLTHRQWAELVGASREAVTIAFKGLERDGRLERRGPRIWVVRTESSHRISAPQETAHGVEIQGP